MIELAILLVLIWLSWQLYCQHEEIKALVNALAEMVGEAIDKNERNNNDD
jgi:hypothetical protein